MSIIEQIKVYKSRGKYDNWESMLVCLFASYQRKKVEAIYVLAIDLVGATGKERCGREGKSKVKNISMASTAGG